MPTLPPAPDGRLIALVLAALVAVLTFASIVQSPAAASTVQSAVAPHDERFQPVQERALPPFGTRTVLAPQPDQQRSPRGADTAR